MNRAGMRRTCALSVILSVMALIALAGCHRAPETQRMTMPDATPAPAPLPTDQPGQWHAYGPERAAYEVGQQAILSLRCVTGEHGSRVEVVHHAAPQPGARALLALIGNGRITRLPVDSHTGTDAGWSGSFAPDDPRLAVFKGGNSIEATLPGGGTARLAGSRAPDILLDGCGRGS